MKILFKYLTAVVGLCVLLTSCLEDDGMEDGSFPRDMSIAGTVSDGYIFYQGTVECKHDGQIICDGTRGYNMHLIKVSDQSVDLWFKLGYYKDTVVTVSIPNIPLSGVPSDANFDHTTSQGVVGVNNVEYSSVTLNARGWIRDTRILKSRFSPYRPDYDSEISITGKVAEKDFSLTMSGSTVIK